MFTENLYVKLEVINSVYLEYHRFKSVCADSLNGVGYEGATVPRPIHRRNHMARLRSATRRTFAILASCLRILS